MTDREKAAFIVGMSLDDERIGKFLADKFGLDYDFIDGVLQEIKAHLREVRTEDRKREAPEIPGDFKFMVEHHSAWQFKNIPPDRIHYDESHAKELCNMPDSCTCQCHICVFAKEEAAARREGEKPPMDMDYNEMIEVFKKGRSRPWWPSIPGIEDVDDDDDDEED